MTIQMLIAGAAAPLFRLLSSTPVGEPGVGVAVGVAVGGTGVLVGVAVGGTGVLVGVAVGKAVGVFVGVAVAGDTVWVVIRLRSNARSLLVTFAW